MELSEAKEKLKLLKHDLSCCEFYDYPLKDNEATEAIKTVLEKLEEYEDLEEQKRLIKLPVAEGTKVYFITSQPYPENGEWVENWQIDEWEFLMAYLPEWGDKLFATRAEAEARLKELEG